ncbi:MAG: 23S rRNA (uracil(1939)-C(5))-methyltransferase RlmD [Gammaproteobacteria bacterium]|nr:23S rRNA (uracil(1939)-C(5))-methyltransferase RlmD [Gammaproteobacteria bacterium]MCP5423501.1 23S rRNA (uracil(1939)-C(5))-methyltransferase RlmD [Gammaproteobacteria bacterium]
MRASRKSSPRPAETLTTPIETLAHDGRGVAHRDGKTVFIEGALPGESVSFTTLSRHNKYDEGRAEEIITPSSERVEPRCAHFGVCGGCSLQHLAADRQLDYKQAWLLDNLSRIGKVQPSQVLEPLRGPHWAYRYKARLGVKYVPKKGRVLVGFRERNAPYLADLRRCEVLHPRVGGLLEALAELVGSLSLAQQVPQIELAAGDETVALSFRVLRPPTEADRARLTAFGQAHDLHIYVQPGGVRSTELLWPEHAQLSYRLPDHGLNLTFLPYHFMQINPAINRQMVDRALNLLNVTPQDRVLDLFCGLGNFTLALARHAREVVGVEGDGEMVDWAQGNGQRNGIHNVRFYADDLARLSEDSPWAQPSYDKILLDPPRSGALPILPRLAGLGAARIVYVSCHPATLARDAAELVHRHGFRLVSAGVMDMFPHTTHVESIALFEA